jgi:hypothetical protein
MKESYSEKIIQNKVWKLSKSWPSKGFKESFLRERTELWKPGVENILRKEGRGWGKVGMLDGQGHINGEFSGHIKNFVFYPLRK